MLRKLADNRVSGSLATQLRRKRFSFLRRLLSKLDKPVRILDLGGTERYWTLIGSENIQDLDITLVNVNAEPTSQSNIRSIAGDARHLDFSDQSFDVVFSNSVIEHVGSRQDQERMASEARRIGKRYFIQTPNRYFPIEPHFLFPFFQFLPVAIRVWLVRHFDVGWFQKTPRADAAREIVTGIRLLTKSDVRRLFPDGRLYLEKMLGMTKSITAYAGWETATDRQLESHAPLRQACGAT